MSNVVLAQKHNSTQMDKLKLSAAGDLKVHIQDGLIGAADNDLSDQATKLQVFPYLEKPDGSLTVAKCDADGNLKAELTSSIDVAIGDVDMSGILMVKPDGTALVGGSDVIKSVADGKLEIDVKMSQQSQLLPVVLQIGEKVLEEVMVNLEFAKVDQVASAG